MSSGKIGPNQEPDYDAKSLPENYGVTEAYLLPRDPYWLFMYWEITDDVRLKVINEIGESLFNQSKPVIRVYKLDNSNQVEKYFDIPVMLDSKRWYINVDECDRVYMCELGIVTPDGRFIGFVKTNSVKLPRHGVSNEIDEKWMSVTEEFEKLMQISGVDYIGKGSAELAKSLAQRWEMLSRIFSRAAASGITSFSLQRDFREKYMEENRKDFWLVADCELVLYGATEPSARVYIGDREIKLNPDGTFALRFHLPDGLTSIPVKAVSEKGDMNRGITIKVTRETNKDE